MYQPYLNNFPLQFSLPSSSTKIAFESLHPKNLLLMRDKNYNIDLTITSISAKEKSTLRKDIWKVAVTAWKEKASEIRLIELVLKNGMT